MTAFLGISVWVTLATVVPGLITIAAISGAVLLIDPSLSGSKFDDGILAWSTPAAAISIMVLTQSVGILLETLLIHYRKLGSEKIEVAIPKGIDPLGETHVTIYPYSEYQGLYLLLSELRNDEDTQGHLQRCIAQFFLTTNSIVSIAVGMVTASALLISHHGARLVPALLFIAFLTFCLALSLYIQRIRFQVMAKALWAARRRRMESDRDTLRTAALALNDPGQRLRESPTLPPGTIRQEPPMQSDSA